MNVEVYGRGMFLIQGNAEMPYLVDLTAHNGLGQCDCMNFITRSGPRIAEGERTSDLRCKHINHVRSLILDVSKVVEEWIEQEKEA